MSGALILGAAWGIYGRLPEKVEGFVVALAGGALIISVVLELVEPATEQASVWMVSAVVLVGAAVFTVLDYYVKKTWGSGRGGGLLAGRKKCRAEAIPTARCSPSGSPPQCCCPLPH
jgi:ZIP family zinc transporter